MECGHEGRVGTIFVMVVETEMAVMEAFVVVVMMHARQRKRMYVKGLLKVLSTKMPWVE